MTAIPTRIAVFPVAEGAFNFALDEALATRAAATGCRLVRVYGWSTPTVSFGRNETALARFRAEKFAAAGIEVVRRPTGGRALVHFRELTYAIAGPALPADSLRACFAEVQATLANALRLLGVAVTIAAAPRPPVVDGAPCFASAAPGELVVGIRKLAASAQRRAGHAWLQHGSVLLHDDQPLLAAGLADGCTLLGAQAPATLVELLGREPTHMEFAEALAEAFAARGVLTSRAEPRDFALDPYPFIQRYRDPAWTWRR